MAAMNQPVIDSSISFGPLPRRLLTRYGRRDLDDPDFKMKTEQEEVLE
jgi:hypothetical protein